MGSAQAEAARQIEALKEQLGRELRRQKVGGRLEGVLGQSGVPARLSQRRVGKRALAARLPVASSFTCIPALAPLGTTLPPALMSFVPAQEAWVASERAKREAWMAEQTRAIKESTVRGLEPEIQVGVPGAAGAEHKATPSRGVLLPGQNTALPFPLAFAIPHSSFSHLNHLVWPCSCAAPGGGPQGGAEAGGEAARGGGGAPGGRRPGCPGGGGGRRPGCGGR